jgi:hypothetical protein
MNDAHVANDLAPFQFFKVDRQWNFFAKIVVFAIPRQMNDLAEMFSKK